MYSQPCPAQPRGRNPGLHLASRTDHSSLRHEMEELMATFCCTRKRPSLYHFQEVKLSYCLRSSETNMGYHLWMWGALLCKEVLIVPFLVPFGINGWMSIPWLVALKWQKKSKSHWFPSKSENVSPISSPNEKEKPVWYLSLRVNDMILTGVE